MAHLVFVLLLITTIYHVQSYFIPGNILKWDEASQYCEEICNSQLASIHSSSEMDAAIAAIQSRSNNIWGNSLRPNDAYIGLKSINFPASPLTWNDSTAFTFGNGMNASINDQYPWKALEPLLTTNGGQSSSSTGNNNTGCVLLNSETNLWELVQCGHANEVEQRFLCNDCNGKITKFSVVKTDSIETSWSAANSYCQSVYGTSLASAHSEDDALELQALYEIIGEDLWIGLSHDGSDETDLSTYSWSDATPFDYGMTLVCTSDNCYPWSDTGPDNDGQCVFLEDVGTWNDGDCNVSKKFICNLPSETSQNINQWTNAYEEQGWTYNATNDEWENDQTGSADLTIDDKQWYNGDQPLVIEWVFSADFNNGNGVTYIGIDIHNAQHGASCEFYYTGLAKKQSTGTIYVDLWRRKRGGQERRLTEAVLSGITFTDGTIYTMKWTVTNGIEFEIAVNDVVQLEYTDNDPYSVFDNGYSGYINIYAEEEATVLSKKFYVSGTLLNTSEIIIGSCPTPQPTMPQIDPTPYPTTAKPTTVPPTESPSINPSNDPTNEPTCDPTYSPSTESPSIDPTEVPSTTPEPTTMLPTDGGKDKGDDKLNAKTLTASPTQGQGEVDEGSNDEIDEGSQPRPNRSSDSLSLTYIIIGICCSWCFCMLCCVIVVWYYKRRNKPEYKNSIGVNNVNQTPRGGLKSVSSFGSFHQAPNHKESVSRPKHNHLNSNSSQNDYLQRNQLHDDASNHAQVLDTDEVGDNNITPGQHQGGEALMLQPGQDENDDGDDIINEDDEVNVIDDISLADNNDGDRGTIDIVTKGGDNPNIKADEFEVRENVMQHIGVFEKYRNLNKSRGNDNNNNNGDIVNAVMEMNQFNSAEM